MKLPRDLSGEDLVRLLSKYGYRKIRQTGSHIRLTAAHSGKEHHVTIPAHSHLAVGLLNQVLSDVAAFLGKPRSDFLNELFG
jgi:predicted RNA binding protein YcfA (HicA-like mRNA interferase family)